MLRPLSRSNAVFMLDFAHIFVYLTAITQEIMTGYVVMILF